MHKILQALISSDDVKQPKEFLCLFLFSVVIVISAFTGVFYSEEYFMVHILSALCILICLFLSGKKNVVIANSFLDYLLLVITLLYIINIAWAAHRQWAFEESLKYINYFLIYWFAAKVINKRQIHSIMKIFIAVGTVLALIGIFSYLQLIPFEGAVQGGRITATLKYPNALGSFLLAAIVLAHFGISEWKHSLVYNLCFYIMAVAFIGTFSRANYLVSVPVIIGVYLAYQGDKKKLIVNSILLLLISISAGAVIFSTAGIYFKLFMFDLGLVAAGISGRKRAAVTTVLIILSLFLLVNPYKHIAGINDAASLQPVDTKVTTGSAPESRVISRIQEIDLEESSLQVRLVLYKDAIELIKENPLLGKGGGAWRMLYPFKRSFLYYSGDPHSYPLKLGAEAGLIGMALFMAMLIYIFIKTIRFVKKENRVVGFALAAIFLHSFVDFDLTIGFISMACWVLLGIFENSAREKKSKELRVKKLYVIIFCGAFLAVSSVLLGATYLADLGDRAAYDKANSRLSSAISLYPINSQNYGTLASVNYKASQLSGNKEYLALALSQIDKAIQICPLNYYWYLDKALYLVEKGEWDQAVSIIKSNVSLIPRFHNDSYAKSAYFLRMAAIGYLEDNDPEKGRQVLEEIIHLWHKAQEEIASVPQQYYSLWREKEIVTEYDPFVLEVINAYDFIGENEKAQALIKKLSQETIEENEWLKDI